MNFDQICKIITIIASSIIIIKDMIYPIFLKIKEKFIFTKFENDCLLEIKKFKDVYMLNDTGQGNIKIRKTDNDEDISSNFDMSDGGLKTRRALEKLVQFNKIKKDETCISRPRYFI